MSIDSQKASAGIREAVSEASESSAPDGRSTDLFDRQVQARQARIQQILAQRKPELIQQGVEAFKRDLPGLLAENRYRQHVAYRGNELVAIAATSRQLSKKLAKLGFTDMGEMFTMPVAPLEIDEDDDVSSEEPTSNPSPP